MHMESPLWQPLTNCQRLKFVVSSFDLVSIVGTFSSNAISVLAKLMVVKTMQTMKTDHW